MRLIRKVLNFSAERYLKTAGDLFVYHSDYEGALDLVKKVLAIDPHDTRALVLYGDILFCLNKDLESLKALDSALALDSTLAEAYISKAGVLEVMGKLREALECCQLALNYVGKEKRYLLSSLLDQKIVLLIRLKRFREAQRLLDRIHLYLPEEEVDYLYTCYKGLLDQMCNKRQQTKEKAKRLSLLVLPGANVPATVNA